MAQHGHAGRARHIVAGRDGAPEERRGTQNLEESRSDAHAWNLHRLAVSRQIHGDSIDGGDLAEGAVARAPIQEILRLNHVGAAERLAFPDHHQTVRLGKWEGAKEDRIDHAENRGGGADAQREHGDGGDGEGGRLAQHADRKSRVARRTLQRSPTPGFARVLAYEGQVAEVAARACRVLAAFAAQLCFLLQVEPYFFIEVPLLARSSPELHRNLLLHDWFHNPRDRLHQLVPTGLFGGKALLAWGGEAVIPRALLVLGHLPLGLNPSLFAKAVQGGIERTVFHLKGFLGSSANGDADSVSMLRTPLQSAQNQHIESTL